MPFDTFTPRQLKVANKTLDHFKQHFGAAGCKLEQEIDPSIAWRPSFFFKAGPTLTIAVEVAEVMYPEILKGAAHEIGHFGAPVVVYQACPLDIYQTLSQQSKVSLLKEHGFGIITVDDDGRATVQNTGIPLAQNISLPQLEAEFDGLAKPYRMLFKEAHTVYRTNVVAGLQQAGQIVEGLVRSFGEAAAKENLIKPFKPTKDLAKILDDLIDAKPLKPHRAAFAEARGFVKNYRNAASHPASSAKQAAARIRKCRAAFLEAVTVSIHLLKVAEVKKYKLKAYL